MGVAPAGTGPIEVRRQASPNKERDMSLPRIVVLGAGLGGTIAAYEIREAVKGKAEVMVVCDQED